MNTGGMTGGQYKPLSLDQIEKIHNTSLLILEEIGIAYEAGLDETLDLLELSGAIINRAKGIISFPRKMVEKQLLSAPDKVTLYSRDRKNDLELTGNRVHMGTGGLAINVVDLYTGKYRKSVLADTFNIAKIVENLENINFFSRPCTASDIPIDIHDINVFCASLSGTYKHFMGGVKDLATFEDIFEIATIVAGSKENLTKYPFCSIVTCFVISPLKLCSQSTLIMQEANRNNIPVVLASAPMAGSTSPRSMAGTLALVHAEELAGVTISQLTNPGAPVLYGAIPGVADMRTMGYLGGAVEFGMMNAAIHQMADHIKIPNYNSSGLTDAKIPDAQAGWEKAISTVLAAMGGSNYIHHAAGMMESMLSIAYEQYVIDDEIIGMTSKILQNIEVDDERLAFDAIKEVGAGGNFIMSPHTLRFMRSEYFEGNGISDRGSHEMWYAEGALDTRERAKKIVQNILSKKSPLCISENVKREIKKKYKTLSWNS